jgi:hypothetical protein
MGGARRGFTVTHGQVNYPACRLLLRRRGICPLIARRGVESSTRLGRQRWKKELHRP